MKKVLTFSMLCAFSLSFVACAMQKKDEKDVKKGSRKARMAIEQLIEG